MTLALPMGRMQFSAKHYSGVQKIYEQSISFQRNITGLGSRMAARSSPKLSSASNGHTVISPGWFEYRLAKHWLCCAATEAAGPFSPLNTIEPSKIPLDIWLTLAQEFMIWSIACSEKFMVMNQQTGFNPINEAPTASPVNPAQVIGVSTSLFDPYFQNSPLVTLQAPLY